MIFGGVAAVVMPLTGDLLAKEVAVRQPVKLAAMEAHFHTEAPAGLLIGGIPDEETMTVDWGIKLPGLLSFLAFGDFNAEVKGLEEFPKENWPPVAIVHYAFQLMVGIGTAMMAIGAFGCMRMFKARKSANENPFPNWFLKVVLLATPLGFIAIEAGWTVTEVGRQPWIIYEVMRTKDALTSMEGLFGPF